MKINEIFYSLQGEGVHAGTPAIFIRFAGCNLDCHFCDTSHSSFMELSEEDIIEAVKQYPAKMVVLTGGEPTLQLTGSLLSRLHHLGKYIAIETNGTHQVLPAVDWITVSPKYPFIGSRAKIKQTQCDEVKVIFDGIHEITDCGIFARHYFVQPCDFHDEKKNKQITDLCIEFVKNNPKWRISIQQQKVLNVQ